MTPAPRTCHEPNCNDPHHARGLCSRHYQRQRIHGTLTTNRNPRNLLGLYGGGGTMSGLNHFPATPSASPTH